MKINDERIIGIDILSKEEYFHSQGCENCNNKLGNDVQDCACITDSEFYGKDKVDDWYSIKLCGGCLNSHYNGEPLDQNCQNIFEV